MEPDQGRNERWETAVTERTISINKVRIRAESSPAGLGRGHIIGKDIFLSWLRFTDARLVSPFPMENTQRVTAKM